MRSTASPLPGRQGSPVLSHARPSTRWPPTATLGRVLRIAGCLGLCFLAGALAASEPIPGPAPGAGLPPGVEPLPPWRIEEVQGLLREAEALRGLDSVGPLPVGRQGPEALARRIDELLVEEYPAGTAVPAARVLELFGWIPGEVDLVETLRELLAEQVAGYFETETGYLVIVDSTAHEPDTITVGEAAERSANRSAEPSPEEAAMADAVLVHEIGHYLQHLHFDLERFEHEGEIFSDAENAGLALVEGDATHLMFSKLLGQYPEQAPGFVDSIATGLADPRSLQEMAAGMAGQEALAAAPAFLRDHLVFPYMHGLLFVSRVREKGGQRLVDHAFRQDPPSSSEQILHPEKWLEERDVPVSIEMPELSGLLGPPRLRGSWGEYSLRVGLRILGGDDAHDLARDAAEGWGGDVFTLYGPSGAAGEVLVWITEWDTHTEANEFRALAEVLFEDWWIGQRETRVALYTGELEPVYAGAVERAILGSRAVRPPGQAPDLEAVGNGGSAPRP